MKYLSNFDYNNIDNGLDYLVKNNLDLELEMGFELEKIIYHNYW